MGDAPHGTDGSVAEVVARDVDAIARELDWLSQVIRTRIGDFVGENEGAQLSVPPAPAPDAASRLGRTITEARLEWDARILLALVLAVQLNPALLDPFFLRDPALDRPFTEFGGHHAAPSLGFVPTGETALFLIAGTDLHARLHAMRLFEPEHALRQHGMVQLEPPTGGGPTLSGALTASTDLLSRVITGIPYTSDRPADFLAHKLSTELGWDDLVLAPKANEQLGRILDWLHQEQRMPNDLGNRRGLARGYRALFHGPPGTGKTLTAAVLGRRAGRDVYRIDLSIVISKFIGETEKNLGRLFDQAKSRNWILFFDEADALFGKRSSAGAANDRHANQEVAQLMQRIEDYPSLVILATNHKRNLDDAYLRRFQTLVTFARPDAT